MLTGLISRMSTRRRRCVSEENLKEKRREVRGLTERLIRNVQVPQVDSQIICTHVRLTIRIDRDRIDVVRMSVCVNFSRYGSDDRVVVSHSR